MPKKFLVALALGLSVMHLGALMRSNAKPAQWLLLGAIAAFGPVVCLLAYQNNRADGTPLTYILSYGVGLGLFFFTLRYRCLVSKFTLMLGAASYALYLFHPIVLAVSLYLFKTLPWPYPAVSLVIAMPLLSIPLAHLIFKYVESPAIALGHKLGNDKPSWLWLPSTASQPVDN